MVLEQLLKHAKRYGREGCDEYAASSIRDVVELTAVIEKLDEVSPPVGKRPKTAEQRAKALLGITEEDS